MYIINFPQKHKFNSITFSLWFETWSGISDENFRFNYPCRDVPKKCQNCAANFKWTHTIKCFWQTQITLPIRARRDSKGKFFQFLCSESCLKIIHSRPNPKTLNFENRSNSAPNVALNSVLKPIAGADQKILVKYPAPLQSYSDHSHSTQASPTNTLKHVKRRQRARSADESKILLSPREQIQTEDWNIDASEILMGPRIGEHGIFALRCINSSNMIFQAQVHLEQYIKLIGIVWGMSFNIYINIL